MKLKAGLILLGALLLGAESDNAKNVKSEISGSWGVSELIFSGDDLTNDSNFQFKIVFKENKVTIEGSELLQADYGRLDFKLNPFTTPKTVNFTVPFGTQKGAIIEGIYILKGEELKICAKIFGNERPTEFKSPEGSSNVLIVLKRSAP